ncbi:protein kinase domain-containing protein [Kribbella lupini]
MALDDIAGYSLRRKLGSGSAGTVWLVRDLASGRHAVLKRIPAPTITNPTVFERDLTTLLAIDHPHIARLIEVRQSESDWLLFGQHVPAGNLTALLGRRGDLALGELVTLISPLAEALSLLHHKGLHHGRLTPANILFDADGRPVITDTALRSQDPTTTQADDLTALAALTQLAAGTTTPFPASLFTDTAAPALARKVLDLSPPTPLNLAFPDHSTSDPQPARSRPLLTPRPAPAPTIPAQTIPTPTIPTLTAPGPTAQAPTAGPSVIPTVHPRRPQNRRKPRRDTTRRARRDNTTRLNQILANTTHRATRSHRTAYGILAASALAALVVTALALTTLGILDTPTTNPAAAAPPSPTPTKATTPTPAKAATPTPAEPPTSTPAEPPTSTPAPTAPPSPNSKAWQQTLQTLDQRRAHAFWTLNPAELDAVYQPGSHPWTTDRAALATYQAQKIRIANLRFHIEHLTQEPTPGPTVTLRVTDRLISATALTPTGRTQLPPGPPTTRRITLAPTGKTWRITTITPA